MSRTARLWKGAGLLTLGGVLLSGVVARGDDGPPLAVQLTDLGRQALAQGAGAMAQTFYQKALQLDPTNAAAIRGLKEIKAAKDPLKKVAFQEPAPAQPAAAAAAPASAVQPPAPGLPATPPPAPAAGEAESGPGIPIVPAPARCRPGRGSPAREPGDPRGERGRRQHRPPAAHQRRRAAAPGRPQPGRGGAARGGTEQPPPGPERRPLRDQRSGERPQGARSADPGPDPEYRPRRGADRRGAGRTAAARRGGRAEGPRPSTSSWPTSRPSRP